MARSEGDVGEMWKAGRILLLGHLVKGVRDPQDAPAPPGCRCEGREALLVAAGSGDPTGAQAGTVWKGLWG